MRGMYISFAMLAIVLIVSVGHLITIHSVSSAFVASAETLERNIDSGNMSEVSKNIQDIEATWDRNSPWIAVFVNHSEMEEIQYGLKRLKTYIHSGDKTMLRAETAELKERLGHLATMERPVIENIL